MTLPTSRALLFDGSAGKLTLVHRNKPAPGPGEVLVRVTASTMCGSDLHTIHGRRKVAVPTILGHEIIGKVEAIGSGFTSTGSPINVGDRITWAVVAHCGHCLPCQRDIPQKCHNGFKYGHEHDSPTHPWSGGFADWCLLAPGTTIVRLPDSLSDALACPASCATSTVCAAMEAAGPLKGRSVLIAGAGLLGLTACAMARQTGASKITCLEPDPHRRDRALAFGATAAVAPNDLGLDEFDVFLELSGANAAWELAFDRLALGARAVLIGAVFPGPDTRINMERIVRRMITIRGIHNYAPRHLEAAISFLAEHGRHVPLAEMVSEWFDLADHVNALKAASLPGATRIGFRNT
ncbi:MAG: zinc-binding dehydrogenase [Gemmataceae bacterium]